MNLASCRQPRVVCYRTVAIEVRVVDGKGTTIVVDRSTLIGSGAEPID